MGRGTGVGKGQEGVNPVTMAYTGSYSLLWKPTCPFPQAYATKISEETHWWLGSLPEGEHRMVSLTSYKLLDHASCPLQGAAIAFSVHVCCWKGDFDWIEALERLAKWPYLKITRRTENWRASFIFHFWLLKKVSLAGSLKFLWENWRIPNLPCVIDLNGLPQS